MFSGSGAELLILYLKNFLLTVLTLGIYSFWARTNVRKFLWSKMSFGGQSFDYHGTGGELLMGFLKFIGVMVVWGAILTTYIILAGEKADGLPVLLFYLPGVFLLPFAFHGAFRYRASRTSWQGRRFSYRGDLWELTKIFWTGAILTLLTLSLYFPFFIIRMRKYFFENLTYGGHRFTFTGEGRELLNEYLKFVLLFLPTLTLYRFWFEAKQNNYCWLKTSFAGAPFRSAIEGGQLLMFSFLKLALGALTLGIAIPFVECERIRYVFHNLWMPQLPAVNLRELAPDADRADMLGEAMSTDIDMADGFGL